MELTIGFVVFVVVILAHSLGDATNSAHREPVTSVEPLSRGIRNRQLIGNRKASTSGFLYHVSIEYVDHVFCGGAIISANYVLTAAHCREKDLENLLVRAGSRQRGKGGSLHRVDKFISPDNFTNVPNEGSDIALIHVVNAFKINQFQRTVRMFQADERMKPTSMVEISSFGELDAQLQFIAVPVINRTQCILKGLENIPPHTFCAGNIDKNVCFGDSGSPVTVNRRLAGIVSYGFNCKEQPGVITEVAYFREWILSVARV